MLTMFQLVAGEDWSEIMRNAQLQKPFCTSIGATTDCGSPASVGYERVAPARTMRTRTASPFTALHDVSENCSYFLTFYVVVVFVFLNL